jgi:hypothetical protein
MTTASFKMKKAFIALTFLLTVSISMFTSCNKEQDVSPNSNQVSSYSADVLDKWMTIELRLMRNATGIPNQAFSRHYVYAGIAALESLAPGLPAHATWSGRWNGLTGMPQASPSVQYYYPANVNAAMASILKSMFPNASVADKAAIDSLENAFEQEFLANIVPDRVTKSSEFGKAVASAVYTWAELDGYKVAGSAYTPPSGPGLWVPTAPNFANAVSPYWGNNRPVITGSTLNTQPPAPTAYSTEENSPFYLMVKHVYDVSQALTTEQKAMAAFWRDVPGVTSPGHWLSIVQQAIRQTESKLDKAALAFALTGAAINDGLISCWQTKYQYNLVRPITYIRNIMGHSSWTSYLGTPAHPEYSSAHAVLSVAAGDVMDRIFGDVGSFTDHTYDYLGMAPRTYTSFKAVGNEAAQSRLFAGIHYQPTIDAGILQGEKVAANLFKVQLHH